VRAQRVLDELRSAWTASDDPVGWWHDGWVHDTVARAADNLDRAVDRWRDLYRTTRAEYLEQGKLAVAPGAPRRAQEVAAQREREARTARLLANENSNTSQTISTPTVPGSEGFLPATPFPTPSRCLHPGTSGSQRDHDGGYLQRPRFVPSASSARARSSITRDPATR